MSTKKEKNIQWANFEKRHPDWKSSIRLHQSGYQEQFGDTQQNAVDTIRKQTDGDVNRYWDGVVPHQDNVDPNVNGAITGVIDAIQTAIETVADSNPEMSDSLKQLLTWASTNDVLTKAPGSPAVRKAVVNPNPTTAPIQHYPDNTNSSRPGPKRTIPASALSDLPESAKNLFRKYEKMGFLEIKL
jgi:hypothetical protein